LNLPTAFWHKLVVALEKEKLTLPSSVRLVNTGGEKLLAQRVIQWHKYMVQAARPVCLINSYGPTEATVVATRCELRSGASSDHAIQSEGSIGRPVGKAQVYVLDRHLNPVPIGVPGELYIGGPGVARGYLNSPELTEEKFIPHPFSDKAGARLYKTGDIVRWCSDGSIEYIERLDQQVKLRGFRIELGEIESALNSYACVCESVVLLREDAPEHKRLVAYIVPTGGAAPSPSELSTFLHRRLPDYMVPEAFVVLEALPLTPNGKVDRQALPTPQVRRPELEGDFMAPRSTLEKYLAGIWEEVLNVPEVGIDDDFFDLGGDSLLAASMFAQIERTFSQQLPLATLLGAPTIRQLANALEGESEEALYSSLVEIQPYGSRPPFFCVHGAGGEVLNFYLLAQHLGPDQPFYAFQAASRDGELDLCTIEEIAGSYIRQLYKLQPKGPYFLGGLSCGGIVALEMAKQLREQDQEVALLALLDPISRRWSVQARMRHHVSKLRDLGLLNYMRGPFIGDIRKIAIRLSLHAGYSLPDAWRRDTIQLHQQAASFYIAQPASAQPYSGRITLFLATDRKPRDEHSLSWEHIALGGVKVHEVPGDHDTFLKEPHVQVLATRLKICLEQAQASQSPNKLRQKLPERSTSRGRHEVYDSPHGIG
jgi:thioesterase domain-containing protein/acyl carrier protein